MYESGEGSVCCALDSVGIGDLLSKPLAAFILYLILFNEVKSIIMSLHLENYPAL